METLAALDEARRTHAVVPEPGSETERAALQRFTEFFSSFAPDRISRLLPQTYAEDIWFNDTLKTLRGRDALAHYLAEAAAAVEECRVQVLDIARMPTGDYAIRWKMMIRFKKLRRGVDTWTVGMSHLRFDAAGMVVYQQDYWNAADGLYEHVPVLGTLIRAIKRRL